MKTGPLSVRTIRFTVDIAVSTICSIASFMGIKMLPTKERLAQKLHSLGLLDLEKRCRDGEFSDFESKHACPKIELVGALKGHYGDPPYSEPAFRLAQEVMEGKWDDTKEEADAWFEVEGKDLLRGDLR